MGTQKENGFIQDPQTIEDFISNANFQLDNVIGWMNCEKFEEALIKTNCLKSALEKLIESKKEKKKSSKIKIKCCGCGLTYTTTAESLIGAKTICENFKCECGEKFLPFQDEGIPINLVTHSPDFYEASPCAELTEIPQWLEEQIDNNEI